MPAYLLDCIQSYDIIASAVWTTRTYAVFGKSRVVLAFLAAVGIVCVVVDIVIILSLLISLYTSELFYRCTCPYFYATVTHPILCTCQIIGPDFSLITESSVVRLCHYLLLIVCWNSLVKMACFYLWRCVCLRYFLLYSIPSGVCNPCVSQDVCIWRRIPLCTWYSNKVCRCSFGSESSE